MLTLLSIKNESKLFVSDTDIEPGYTHLLIYHQWRFFYSLEGDNAPLEIAGSESENIPDYIALMLYKFETAYTLLIQGFSLKDPLATGSFFEKGAKFIDIYIRNIPREHGIASGIVFDKQYKVLDGTDYQDKSIRIVVHRNLIARTATPMHELFHIFQYACCPFNNMWFMEGLARWCQSIVQVGRGKEEKLPQTAAELDVLVHKLHDAEFFWNRLASLCEDSDSFEIPEYLADNTEIYNNQKTGSQFIPLFLQQCSLQADKIQQQSIQRQVKEQDYWPRQEKRSTNNNQAIFAAIIESVSLLKPTASQELSTFIKLISPLANININDYNHPDIQALLAVLYQYTDQIVLKNEQGIYYSEFYDIFTQTFSYQKIQLTNCHITDTELESFKVIRRIKGSLLINHCPSLTRLDGLRNIIQIDGDFVLNDLSVSKLDGLNSLIHCHRLAISSMPILQSINGFNGLLRATRIIIKLNQQLFNIAGFNSLDVVSDDLGLIENASLVSVTGFNSLNKIEKGSLRIEANLKLESVFSFASLKHISKLLLVKDCPVLTIMNRLASLENVKNIEIIGTSLQSADFLQPFFSKNITIKGYVKIINSLIQDVKFMQGVKEITSSFYLHQNKLQNLSGLEQLEKVGGSFSLATNQLENLKALSNLKSVNGLLSLTNNRLNNFSGLENLQRLETRRWGGNRITLKFYGNKDLYDISALKNIQTHDHYCVLYFDKAQDDYKWPDVDSLFFKNMIELHNSQSNQLIPSYKIHVKKQHCYSLFRKTTHNKVLTELFDFESDADTLVMSFTGAYGNLGGLFYNKFPLITEGVNTHKVFLMDPSHTWYNTGICGLTNNLQESIDLLATLVQQKKYQRVVCMGASMGAYLALIVGNILQVDEVLAFSPQTFLDTENRKSYGETRWASLVKKIPKETPPEFLDLQQFFKQHKNDSTQFYIHYAEQLLIDKYHAEHISEQANIHRVVYPVDDHYITVMLHKEERLNPIIRQCVIGNKKAS